MVTALEIGLVAIGGASGAALRFISGRVCDTLFGSTSFPIATLLVNITGCFMIGAIAGASLNGHVSSHAKLLIVTGLLGGFTTFSAFGLETVTLVRTAHLSSAMLYVVGSVVGGIVAVVLGSLASNAILSKM